MIADLLIVIAIVGGVVMTTGLLFPWNAIEDPYQEDDHDVC